jgi:hypothetical protein
MADDPALQTGILDALREYNTEQYITVKLPDQENEVTTLTFIYINSLKVLFIQNK